jgi:Carboxypeptidase regulatory-like domain/TonB-dependent Receptor Plug Domain
MHARLALALLSLAAAAFSQNIITGDVAGVVTDTSGATVPGATVTLTSVDTNEARTLVTSSVGQYHFTFVKPGQYTISATSEGLKSSIEKISVLVGQEQGINLTMSVQSTQETVEVTTQAAAIQTENANLASAYDQKQITELPFNGGDITTVAFTVPGVVINIGGTGSGNFNVNGIPGTSVVYAINGADFMDPYSNNNNSGASNNLLGANEIAEAAVVLNAYSAQYGRMAGAQVNYITKSGTNSFHGNLVYNYNGDFLNSNDFFKNASLTPRPHSVANQYSGSIGGPIIKNKTFFFFNTEGLRYVLPASAIVSIPTPAFQSYILSHIPSSAVPLYQDAFTLFNNAPGIDRAVPVTTGNGPLQDSSGHLGCQSEGTFAGTSAGNGQIFGVNTPCAMAFGTNVNQVNTESIVEVRGDHSLNDRQKLAARYKYDWGLQASGPSVLNPAFNKQSYQPSSNGQLTYTYIINPNLVNNLVGSAMYYRPITGVPDFQKALSLMPIEFAFADGGANGGGFPTVGAALPTGRRVLNAQLVDDLSWTKSTHLVKTGVNYKRSRVTDTTIGSGTIEGIYTFNDLTDFATGRVNSTNLGSNYTQSFTPFSDVHIRLYSLGFYAQDEWSVRRNLKITYGIRFERDEDPVCTDGCFARMNEPFGSAGYQGGVNIPYDATITTGLHQAYQNLEAIIPEPRLGVVFSPFGSNKTVFRGGIGLFSNLFPGNVAQNLFKNSPNVFSPVVTSGIVGLTATSGSSQAEAVASAGAFFSGFSQGLTLAQIQAALGSTKFALPSYYSPPQNFAAPKILEWSFEAEQQLSTHNVLAVTYAGNHGYDEPLSNADANSYINGTSRYPNGFAGLPYVAPDPRFLTVTQVEISGVSNYDALTTQLRHAFDNGLQGQIGFTWSHALGDVGVYNPYNLNSGYGDLPFDVRRALTADLVWKMPYKFSNRVLNSIAGEWTFGGKVYVYSGRPFSVTNSKIPAQINSAGGVGNTVLADLIVPGVLQTSCGHAAVNTKCLTAADFASSTAQDDFGNIPPDSFRGPGYFDIDSQITKGFQIREKFTFAFGAQAYNVFNHVNLGLPQGNVTASSFGLITTDVSPPNSIYGTGQGAAVSGRILVLVGKFNF